MFEKNCLFIFFLTLLNQPGYRHYMMLGLSTGVLYAKYIKQNRSAQ